MASSALALTSQERWDFFLRHPLITFEVPFIPSQGKLVNDEVLGMVLMYKKTDGTLLLIKVNGIYPDDKALDTPGYWETFTSELVNQIGQRSNDIFDSLTSLALWIVIILIVYFVASGNANKLLKSFK